ncbi:MAG TPA: DUF4446 family protein [Armatimonadota bacterium]|jgi:hypothetical protein
MIYLEVVTSVLAAAALVASLLAWRSATRARRLVASLSPDTRELLSAWRELEPPEAAGQLAAFLEHVGRKLHSLDSRTQLLADKTRQAYAHRGLVRFDSTEEIKGNLSFALALLDDEQNGFILTSLCSLTGSRIFLRMVTGGQVDRELLPEESEALRLARQIGK